jgi:hypothetical protein
MPLFGPSPFQAAKELKVSQRQNALDEAEKALNLIPVHPEEQLILTTPAWKLAEKIKNGEWTSLTVVAAFARRCIETHNDINTFTEGFPKSIVLM